MQKITPVEAYKFITQVSGSQVYLHRNLQCALWNVCEFEQKECGHNHMIQPSPWQQAYHRAVTTATNVSYSSFQGTLPQVKSLRLCGTVIFCLPIFTRFIFIRPLGPPTCLLLFLLIARRLASFFHH